MLHRRVAEALELVHADDLDTVAAALADQYERAGRPGPRGAASRSAPHEVAAGVFANQKAIRHYRRAAELLRGTPAGRDRDVTRAEHP